MSLKLDDGMRIKNANIEEVKKELLLLKSYFKLKLKSDIYDELSSVYFDCLDNVNNVDREIIPYEKVKNYLEVQIETFKNKKYSRLLNKGFIVYIKQYKNDVYVYPFSNEENNKTDLVEKVPEIENYSYWNDSNRPSDVSESHWNKRNEIWKEIYKKYTFEESGFEKIIMSDVNDILDLNFSYDSFKKKSKEKRMDRIIKNHYIAFVYNKIKEGMKEEDITRSLHINALNCYIFDRDCHLENKIKNNIENRLKEINKENFYIIRNEKKMEYKIKIEINDE
jgi:hypothetical protein